MVFSGKYSRSPIASTNLVLKYTVFVNKFTLSTHDLDVITILLPSMASVALNLRVLCCCCCCCFLFSS
uniref:Uncharacterized protein n=1 Tax=Strix occidentalis caurina TaxID=311401 RepID=A0A8D0FWT5_STROC